MLTLPAARRIYRGRSQCRARHRRECQGGGRREGRRRPFRLPLPRPRQGAGRCRARGWPAVLMLERMRRCPHALLSPAGAGCAGRRGGFLSRRSARSISQQYAAAAAITSSRQETTIANERDSRGSHNRDEIDDGMIEQLIAVNRSEESTTDTTTLL